MLNTFVIIIIGGGDNRQIYALLSTRLRLFTWLFKNRCFGINLTKTR